MNGGPAQAEGQDRPVLRPAASSPDIKALFDHPAASGAAQAYSYLPPDTTPTNANVNANLAGQSPSYNYQPLYQPKPASPGLPDLHTPRFYAPQTSSYTNSHGHGHGHHGHSQNYSISGNFVPSHPTRLSEETVSIQSTSASSKRESDPVMDDKLKDLIRRGALGHHMNARAQSLDISQQTKTFGRHASPGDPEAVGAALSSLRL